MIPSKKVSLANKNPRRPTRPYPKGDITIEDQHREQKKLLSADKGCRGHDRLNMNIIAISFENKCFQEAKNREDYMSKIRTKLREWDYVPEDDAGGDGPLQQPPQPHNHQPQSQPQHNQSQSQMMSPELQSHKNSQPTRTNHQRHHSGPSLTGHVKTNGNGHSIVENNLTSPSKQLMYSNQVGSGHLPSGTSQGHYQSQFPPSKQNQQHHLQGHLNSNSQEHSREAMPHSQRKFNGNSANQGNGCSNIHVRPSTSSHPIRHSSQLQTQGQQQHHQQHHGGSPKSQPMTHSNTTISTASSNESSQDGQFVNIFDNKFLSTINLNDPQMRNLWVNSVYEYFLSGGTLEPYQNSQTGSPLPMYSTALPGANGNGNDNVEMQGVQGGEDLGMLGNYGGFQERLNENNRHDEGRTLRMNSGRSGHGSVGSVPQWISPLNMLDVDMGNMEEVLVEDIISGPMGSPPSGTYGKWAIR